MRQRLLRLGMDAGRVHPAPHLDHHVLVEPRQGAAGVRQVHRQPFAGVVVVGVHHVERQLQLVDAATRPVGVELGDVREGLLGVVLPVVRQRGHDLLRPGAPRPLQLAQDLRAVVVVLEVVGRHRPHRHRQFQHPPGMDVDRRVVAPLLPRPVEQRHQVLAVVEVLERPGVVVHPGHGHARPLGIEAGGAQGRVGEVEQPLAHRPDRHVGEPAHRLGDDVHRVGVVEDDRLGCHRFDVGDDAGELGDRPQRHEEAAGTLGLLADHPVLERNAFVQGPRLEVARTEAGQHGVRVGQGCPPVGRGPDRDVESLDVGDPLRQPADDLQAIGVEVDQDDLRALEMLTPFQERRHGARSPGRASTDVDQLDRCHFFLSLIAVLVTDRPPLRRPGQCDPRTRRRSSPASRARTRWRRGSDRMPCACRRR